MKEKVSKQRRLREREFYDIANKKMQAGKF